MLRTPSGRRNRRQSDEKLNLIPILDSVFIFIFFLLMSASFLNVFEISSNVPFVSAAPPPKNTRPLALTLIIDHQKISVATGVPSRVRRVIRKDASGEYNLERLKDYLISLKKRYKHEQTAILEPRTNIDYETLVQIMDTVRMLRATDEDIFFKDKNGVERKINALFDRIIFGNILS